MNPDEWDRLEVLSLKLSRAIHKRMGESQGYILILCHQSGPVVVSTDIPHAGAVRVSLEAALESAPVGVLGDETSPNLWPEVN